ncbi:MAG: hypothetical protein AAFU55_15810, partial [Pseudomonadota bacterium]
MVTKVAGLAAFDSGTILHPGETLEVIMSNPEDRKNAARATEFPLDKTEMYPSQKRRFEEVGEGMA